MDERGTLVWGGSADCTLPRPIARVSAPPGDYRLYARGEGELHAEGPFRIGGTDGSEPPGVFALIH